MTCPNCGKNSVSVQIVQEERGKTQISKTKSKYKEKGHGLLWWLLIGWWWWIVDLSLWVCFFLPRLILRLFAAPFKKKKYTGESTTIVSEKNDIGYKKMFVCQECGHSWSEDA